MRPGEPSAGPLSPRTRGTTCGRTSRCWRSSRRRSAATVNGHLVLPSGGEWRGRGDLLQRSGLRCGRLDHHLQTRPPGGRVRAVAIRLASVPFQATRSGGPRSFIDSQIPSRAPRLSNVSTRLSRGIVSSSDSRSLSAAQPISSIRRKSPPGSECRKGEIAVNRGQSPRITPLVALFRVAEAASRREIGPWKEPICSGFPEARNETRTRDPFLTMEVLYQLSYPGGAARTVGRSAITERS